MMDSMVKAAAAEDLRPSRNTLQISPRSQITRNWLATKMEL